jgi:hypothetical protein
MRNSRVMILGILLAIMVVGLSGCIISTSPGTQKVIVMNPGEKKVFKVSGVNLNTPTTKCVWYINRMDMNTEVFENTDHVEFTVNPEGEKSNKVIITCEYHIFVSDFLGWLVIGSKDWNIYIPRDTAPVWQGDYYIFDRTDVQMLNGYTEITGDLDIQCNLKSLKGLENLTSVGGNLSIEENDALTSLSGLESLTSVGGSLSIGWGSRWSNPALTSLSGIENLTSVGGRLSFEKNRALTNLSGLENLTSVGGNLVIDLNPALTSLSGLENITSLGGGLIILQNNALTNLAGLENITSLDGGLEIWDNNALTNLAGLENITSIGRRGLRISINNVLTSLGMTGLQRVDGDFEISSNVLLCTSLAEELMNQVIAGGGIGGAVDIHGNKECTTP